MQDLPFVLMENPEFAIEDGLTGHGMGGDVDRWMRLQRTVVASKQLLHEARLQGTRCHDGTPICDRHVCSMDSLPLDVSQALQGGFITCACVAWTTSLSSPPGRVHRYHLHGVPSGRSHAPELQH